MTEAIILLERFQAAIEEGHIMKCNNCINDLMKIKDDLTNREQRIFHDLLDNFDEMVERLIEEIIREENT